MKTCYEHILMNTMIYRMLEEVKYNYDPASLTLDEYDYSEWYKIKSGDEEELDYLPPLEVDEEKYYSVMSTPVPKGVKEGKGLKILTPNKSLTQIMHLSYQNNKITKKVYNYLIKSL